MILAAGLTPAWQQILLFDRFQPGEVNRACQTDWCASGKVLNVGRAAHALGASCRTLALVGGRSGAAIQQEFVDAGIDARWIETEAPTRVCTTILDARAGVTTELVEESPRPTADELATFEAAYDEESRGADVIVLTGSLPPGVPAEFYRRLLDRTECRTILDIRGPELLSALQCGPFLVKPNRDELGRTFNRTLEAEDETIGAVQRTLEQGAQWVVVTDGGHPAIIGSADCLLRLAPPTVEAVNPIGCGDCLAAGIAVGLDEGLDAVDAIRFGMAAAVENVRQQLPARLERAGVEAAFSRLIGEPI